MSRIVIADTNALYRLLDQKITGHEAHRKALAAISHLVISPLVLAELDCLITSKKGLTYGDCGRTVHQDEHRHPTVRSTAGRASLERSDRRGTEIRRR
ncbi:PIN domain-containing protein [Streptomyces olivoreticuli]|uniref:PIN domain-containing protein n=1 Tax=Streptomyces olivoreticuli TaxID=68246 RepID=UPI003463044F